MESGSLVILSESLVILSAAKDLALGSQMLHYAQHDTTGSLVILSGPLVILSEAKDLALGSQMLRGVYPERSEWAQHDTTGFGRYSSLSVATSDNQGNPIALPEL